ncbi:hypothetical protein OFM39_28810, partial [Escherichia coli]|nr:hypothetical protein [Escherichia coli]
EEVKIAHSEYAHISLNGIINKDPDLLNNLNTFFESLLNEAKELGIVNTDKEPLVFTKDNLPWFWCN